MKTLLVSSSFIEQKSFLRSFIKRIELNEPKVVIDYTMPLSINGLTTTEEVLRIEGLGSPDGSIHRTFRAVFKMPVVPLNITSSRLANGSSGTRFVLPRNGGEL
jgi:hypothetical protein